MTVAAGKGGVSKMDALATLAVESEIFPYSPPRARIMSPRGLLIEGGGGEYA